MFKSTYIVRMVKWNAEKHTPCTAAYLVFQMLNSSDCVHVQALKERIQRDLGIFRGQFTQYDVFNELVAVPSMIDHCNMRATVLRDAFHWARAADPSAGLCLNEWAVLDTQNWQDFLDLIRELQQSGAPVTCIGIQAHLMRDSTTFEAMWERLNQLASTGLPIYITEFSLSSQAMSRLSIADRASDLSETEQSEFIKQLVSLWFSHPAIKGITMWGFWDGHIWNKGGGIFRADGSPKPAANMLNQLWRVKWNTTITNGKLGLQVNAFNSDAGAEQVVITPGANGAKKGTVIPVDLGSAPSVLQFQGFYGRYNYEFFADGRRFGGTMRLTEGGAPSIRLQLSGSITLEG